MCMTTNCSHCKKELTRPKCQLKRVKNSFCNRKCQSEWRVGKFVGKDNPCWKGGRYINKRTGYVYIYKKGHPKSNNWGYVAEHVLVAEKEYGDTTGYHVHHLNGVRADNRKDNLAMVKPKDHGGYTVRQALQERIRELENKLKTLRKCYY